MSTEETTTAASVAERGAHVAPESRRQQLEHLKKKAAMLGLQIVEAQPA